MPTGGLTPAVSRHLWPTTWHPPDRHTIALNPNTHHTLCRPEQTNGPYEKNEDAAFIARLWAPVQQQQQQQQQQHHHAGGYGARAAAAAAPLGVTAAVAGCGLKNTDPGSGNGPWRRATGDQNGGGSVGGAEAEAALPYHIAVGALEDHGGALSAAAGGDDAALAADQQQRQRQGEEGAAAAAATAAAAAVAHLAAVLDGHGGRGTAKWASRRLPRLVAEHLGRATAEAAGATNGAGAATGGGVGAAATAALVGALRAFDRWWADAAHDPEISRHGHDDSGSTAALALIAPAPGGGWRVAVANLGDSRALLVGADASVTPLSEVHNTGNAAELARLAAAGAQLVHPSAAAVMSAAAANSSGDDDADGDGAGASAAARQLADGHARFFPKGPIWGRRGLKVSRALGDASFKRPQALVSAEPATRDVALPPGGGHRLLLLLTDGVTDVLSDAEIASTALAALSRPPEARLPGLPPHDDDARAAARAVVAAAAAHRLAHDNMTCAACVFA